MHQTYPAFVLQHLEKTKASRLSHISTWVLDRFSYYLHCLSRCSYHISKLEGHSWRYVSIHLDLTGYKVDAFEAIKSHQREDYMSIYKKLREFYMAERNFMLTLSALSSMFIFKRFMATFNKWYDL